MVDGNGDRVESRTFWQTQQAVTDLQRRMDRIEEKFDDFVGGAATARRGEWGTAIQIVTVVVMALAAVTSFVVSILKTVQ